MWTHGGPETEPGVRYLSGLNVVEEVLSQGRFVCSRRSATGGAKSGTQGGWTGSQWVSHLVGHQPMEAFYLEVDGQALTSHWTIVRLTDDGEDVQGPSRHAVVEIAHRHRPIRVAIHTKLDGTPFIERWLEITNTGLTAANLSAVSPLSGLLWYISDYRERSSQPEIFRLGYLAPRPLGYEGDFTWRPLPEGRTRIVNDQGRSGWGVPFFMVQNLANGEVFIGHLEWSANWFFEFQVQQGRTTRAQGVHAMFHDAALYFQMGPHAPAPLRIIEPNETVRSPVIHLGHLHTSLDQAVQQLHAHLRRSVLPPQIPGADLLVGSGLVVAGGEEWLKKEVDIASEMGMEYFVVDAGWYGHQFGNWYDTVGDWNTGIWLEHGLETIREYIHAHGMKFGLWMEPESIGAESELLKSHPDWATTSDDRPIAEGRVLDFSRSEVQQWVESEITRVLEQYQPDLFKLDYNSRNIHHEGEVLHGGFWENTQWRHVEFLYALLDRMRTRYPHIIWENCSAGGGRNDLGMLRRTDISALSDYTVPPRSLKAINNLTMAYPPEVLKYYFGHWPGYHLYGDLDYQLRVTLFVNPIFVGFGRGDQISVRLKETIQHYVTLYRRFVRPMLPGCAVYHHTPALTLETLQDWCVLEYVAQDRQMAYVGIFKLERSLTDDYWLRPKGLDPGFTYQVRHDGSGLTYTASGYTLATSGIHVVLDGVLLSELLLFERRDEKAVRPCASLLSPNGGGIETEN